MASDAPGGVVVTEEQAEFLLRRLEALNDDYTRTLEAERAPEVCAADDAIVDEALNSDTPATGGEAEYAALGAFDNGSEGSSDDEQVGHSMPGESLEWSSFASAVPDGVALEDFADFDQKNWSVPLPPVVRPSVPALTHDEASCIQSTMSKLNFVAPAWAQHVSDDKFAAMLAKFADRS
uniref:Uncharacterized protein n=1 Tax=Noctiluca scintillans TaxID=2966 RepID=A0A7S1F4J1_NOCSC|mmetsp:Transcript_31848/g.85092  ORF Transcript_31848/g.85092 Transcript_31848/m.85092 type:complete len:179 (+) Transcript_31848:57-593(+)|eukprot:CAMPEP_0194533518 /NCGR_PEP_ID=MMETSP0253-20130528/71421_1 /TAXON_ID=2966 /ORGANISM="Noctiluca scintillans" /LENGTH=178 /DNA_ID=CAMNT_0039379079 /DNA_START=6 /DNA_END=542 /DNA_ORIENTATION=+